MHNHQKNASKGIGGRALVVEGGGMRGVFAAGVLDCFLEENFDPFDSCFGVSAGSCNLASFLGNQHGRNYRSYTDYMLKPDFFSLKKYLRGGHYMDLDWLWDYLAQVEPLNVAGASARDFYVTVTNVQTGRPEYIRAEERTLFSSLKASCAMPLLYRGHIRIDGAEYIDGGMTDSIPVAEACRRGARRILVIRSQVTGYRKKDTVESRLLPILFHGVPALKKSLAERAWRYNNTLDTIKNPPDGAEVIEVCPAMLYSKRTTKNRALLETDYAEGKRMGLEAIGYWNGL